MRKYQVTPRAKDLTETRKREFYFSSGFTTVQTNSYWNGGSISYWKVYNIRLGLSFVPTPGEYPWNTPNDYILTPGDVVIETGRFNNKEKTPCFRCRIEDEADVLKWLEISLRSQSQPIVPLGFASFNPETNETTIRTH